MIRSIIQKEWLKLKFIILLLMIVSFVILANFWYNLNFQFSTVEPESMMWYRFASLEQKPYESLSYLFYIIGFAVAVFQFVPEKIKNRIKIMTHLPISLKRSLFLHLFIGIFYIFILSLLLTLTIVMIVSFYYPLEIGMVSVKDTSFYFLGSIIVYLGISSAVIEKNAIISTLKLFITLLLIFVFHKTTFSSIDFTWIFIALILLFVSLDSFYSIKEQRLKSFIFKFSIFISTITVLFFSYQLYIDKYENNLNKYYIFYSPILKKFVYQKNFGEHQFEYGTDEKETFDMNTYKSYLPFVYWRDLDIQGKLPLHLDGEMYDKKTIKESRLSFSYNPSLLKKQEIQIYPFFNPQSNIGMIRFPEEMVSFENDTIDFYELDHIEHDESQNNTHTHLIEEMIQLPLTHEITFPIKNVWGKATNMKPFDLGYFMLDSNNKLFRLNRYDNTLYLNHIKYPDGIELKFMKISENKKRGLAGFAIDSKSNFYILDYQTLKFKKIDIEGFDYKKMKLLFISNPKYYLVRYDDHIKYHAAVFDKDFNKIDEKIFK
ncbi:DUF4857 domain-containing protein [Candidatus Marinarcus aquaticus]|uniref:DUF4857 domain-containing protein n=1 Tax=Candidatus Marinarcus aquaticus TaxID=2044504 RepID=A0A4Q0XVE7_9BACT|nr:DUF4857 domain-containing protein [Candidatus Marinarcus aquaticus]RXJ60574.1 DUF4857 domain-containing protein [Candidatus Marinarcus aquaticus]